METKEQVKEKKSAHLRELEDVFEKRARRFSPFAILGLRTDENQGTQDKREETQTELKPSDEKTEGNKQLNPGVGLPTPPLGDDRPMGGVSPPMGGVGLPTPGVGKPTRVVVNNNIITTTNKNPTPGVGLPTPPLGKKIHQEENYNPPVGVIDPPRGGSDDKIADTNDEEQQRIHKLKVPQELHSEEAGKRERAHQKAFLLPEMVAAGQLGAQLGEKAREVLAYLNRLRSLEHSSYTMPVGYGQISTAAQVDPDHLRRKVLPKLAMLGLIAIARKSLDGTVYHLPYDVDYVDVITGRKELERGKETRKEDQKQPDSPGRMAEWPEWIDREQWGWLSYDHIRRLIEKAGSEAQAQEKLEIISYNETHGPPHQRVRNRRSVLAHYLSSPDAELWPNDEGFETVKMRQARLEKELAQKEKALADEVLRARREARKARFLAALSDAQMRWLKQEAKRVVDARPDSKFLSSRYPLYRAQEETLVEEWMDRVAYGEPVPSADPENNS